ncbi:glutathione S-transferase [Lactarius vividus]|nr:glutathione S-transferase [Lactarius vividus]
MATPDIIFYTAKICPYAQRVEIAFQEVKADVTRYSIDLGNKPEWYASRVNPASKVPAVVYGGPKSDPENPSPESARITESLVLLEFVADLYPDSGLLPKDPVERARIRFFIDAVSTKVSPVTAAFFFRGESPDAFIAAAAEIQELLSPTAQFAVGDHFTIADAAIAPFLARWELQLRNDVGKFAEGTGPRVHKELFQSERFARLQKYLANISSRESFKSSFDSEYILATIRKYFGRL